MWKNVIVKYFIVFAIFFLNEWRLLTLMQIETQNLLIHSMYNL